MKEFIIAYKDLLGVIIFWLLSTSFFGVNIGAAVSIVSFILLLNSQDSTKIFFGFLTILILSDTRTASIAFAPVAKIPITVLLAIYMYLKRGEFPFGKNEIFRSFLPFFVFVALALPFAQDFFNSFQKALSYFLLFALIPPLLLKASNENQQFKSDAINFFVLIIVIGMVSYFIIPDYATLVGRFRGVLGNPNGLGIFLTITFPIFYLVLNENQTNVKIKYLIYLLVVFNVVLTQSRTAIMAILIFYIFSRTKALRGGVGVFVLLVAITAYQLFFNYLPLIITTLGLQEYLRIDTLEEASGRLIAWEFAWNQIQNYFFMGGGFDFTNQLFHQNYSYLSQLGHQGNAHNSFLTIWLDNGIIGLILYLFGLISLSLKMMKINPITLAALYSFVFSANFESWLTASLNPFTILFIAFFTFGMISKNADQLEGTSIILDKHA